MFWRAAGLATPSPVDALLDKEAFTLSELLDEEDIIQECKALNGRLVAYLQEKERVAELVRYITEEPSKDSDDKRCYKYPFVSCEVFTCDIDMVFNTLLENSELMDLLFSFVEPDRSHTALLAGYFSKVVIRLLVRRTHNVMSYIQEHRDILKKLVDLIGITSIMEVIMALMGAEEQILMFQEEEIQWLTDTDMLEMLVAKLGSENPSDVHANAAEALMAVARTMPSALAMQLASPKYISMLFAHVLECPERKSGLIHSLSVCIALLDPRRAASAMAAGAARGLSLPGDCLQTCSPETVEGMLQQLGELVALLDTSGDSQVMPTTYGELKPPLGMHRLKIVEFVAVLFRTHSEVARQQLVELGVIQTALKLFFDFPFNNLLHAQVESIVTSCLESCSPPIIDCLFRDCSLVQRILLASDQVSSDSAPNMGTVHTVTTKPVLRSGNMGHIIRIANRVAQMACTSTQIDSYVQANDDWVQWQSSVLQPRNHLENVHQWSCGRPVAVANQMHESDDEEFRDRDFDIAPNSIGRDYSHHRYDFDAEDLDEVDSIRSFSHPQARSVLDRDDEDGYFDDDVAEQTISSLQLGESDTDGDLLRRAFAAAGRASNLHRFDDFDSDEEVSFSPEPASSAPPAGSSATNSLWSSSLSGKTSNPGITSAAPTSSSDDDEVIVGSDDDDEDVDFSPRDALPSRASSSAMNMAAASASFRSNNVLPSSFSPSAALAPPPKSIAMDLFANSPFTVNNNAVNSIVSDTTVDLFAGRPAGWDQAPGFVVGEAGGGDAGAESTVDLFLATNSTRPVDVPPLPPAVPPPIDLFANGPAQLSAVAGDGGALAPTSTSKAPASTAPPPAAADGPTFWAFGTAEDPFTATPAPAPAAAEKGATATTTTASTATTTTTTTTQEKGVDSSLVSLACAKPAEEPPPACSEAGGKEGGDSAGSFLPAGADVAQEKVAGGNDWAGSFLPAGSGSAHEVVGGGKEEGGAVLPAGTDVAEVKAAGEKEGLVGSALRAGAEVAKEKVADGGGDEGHKAHEFSASKDASPLNSCEGAPRMIPPSERSVASPKSPKVNADYNDKNFWKSSYDMSVIEGEDL